MAEHDDSGDWPSEDDAEPSAPADREETRALDSFEAPPEAPAADPQRAAVDLTGAAGDGVVSLRDVLRAGPLAAAHKVCGSVLGPYVVEAEIGRGGMGAVFRARHERLEREVALKVLLAGVGASPRQRKRFLREATVGVNLFHPGIVRVHDYGEEEDFPYIAMELVKGTTLHRKLESVSRPELVALLIKVGDALGHAHHNQVIHRDLKPANILIREDGEPVVTDFGLARDLSASSGVTKDGATLGTPVYMAPEQTRGEKPVPATDVFSLGVLLYRGLTGAMPFDGERLTDLYEAINTKTPPSPSALDPTIPPSLSRVCLKALAKEPADRYPDGHAFARALRSYRQGPLPRPPLLPHAVAVGLIAIGGALFAAALFGDPREAAPETAAQPRPAPSLAPLEDGLPLPKDAGVRDGVLRRTGWALGRGLSLAAFKEADAESAASGMRLERLLVNQSGSAPRFFALWRSGEGKSLLGLDREEQLAQSRALRQRYEPLTLATWGQAGAPLFGSGWAPLDAHIHWRSSTERSLQELTQEGREARDAGLRPIALAATPGAERRYSALFRGDGQEGQSGLELTRDELARWVQRYSQRGHRLLQVSAYGPPSRRRHAVLSVVGDEPGASFLHLPPEVHAHVEALMQATGHRPVFVTEEGSPSGKRTLSSAWVQEGERIWRVRGPEVPGLAAVEALVRAAMKGAGVSQGALAVVRGRRLVLARGYTWAPAERAPTDPRSLFRLGSISKALTAVATLRLVEEGRLSLTATVGDLFPELRREGVRDSWDSRLLGVTVRHLLQHRGGWDRHLVRGRLREGLDYRIFDPTALGNEQQVLGAVGGALPLEPARVMDYMNREPLEFDPGSRFAYSNYGYLLLGLIVERVSGRSYEAYLRREVLPRVGATALRIGGGLGERVTGEVLHEGAGLALDARGQGTVVPLPYALDLRCMAAHDGWIGSAVDVARVVASLSVERDGPLLQAASVRALWTAQEDAPHGMGWSVTGGRVGARVGWIPGAWGHVEGTADTAWVLLFNQRIAAGGDLASSLRGALDAVTDWPEHDLFPLR